jgi:2-octaprenyl-6-methoxyphenol hydroxylase
MFTSMTKTPVTTDIFISGVVAGLTAAAAFGAAGFSVVIADRYPSMRIKR